MLRGLMAARSKFPSKDGKQRPRAGGGKPRGRGRDARPARPVVRRPGVKIPESVAYLVRAGHPWIFRNTVRRSLTGIELNKPVAVLDEGGKVMGWGLVEPDGAIAVRMLGLSRELEWNADTLKRRVEAAKRRRVAAGVMSSACRLVHGEADGLPGLAVDRLGDFLLVYKYSRVAETYLDELIPVLEQVYEPAGIYMQDRVRPVQADDRRPPAFHLAGRVAPPEYEVDEDGLKFMVDVTAPVSPGLFLDLREGRRLCESWVKDRAVLNLFSFTGAFGLRAVRGGASAVTNIDAAARSHARCRQNLAASGFDPEACEAVSGDVFKHLERFRQRGRQFDFVVVDPPPFSNVKGTTFSALKDWAQLVRALAPVVVRGGYMLAVCNAARLTEEAFLVAVGEGTRAAGRTPRVLLDRGLPPDFPVPPAFTEGRYLKIKLVDVG